MEFEWIIEKKGSTEYFYTHPAKRKENNFYQHGFFTENSAAYDLRDYKLLEMVINTEKELLLEIDFCLLVDNSPLPEKKRHVKQTLALGKTGRTQVCLELPQLEDFDALSYDFKFVQEIKICAETPFELQKLHLKKGSSLRLSCEVRSKAVKTGESAIYPLKILNCHGVATKITLFHKKEGWEILDTFLEDRYLTLEPYEEKTFLVKVNMNERLVPGGYEKQRIIAIPEGNGREAQEITFTTARYLPHPNLLCNTKEIEAAKLKRENFEWAEKTAVIWEEQADQWQVPVMEARKHYLFMSRNADNARGCAIMYQLTGKKEYAKKVADMLLQLADPKLGYLRLPHASNQELVHEGGFFKHIAIAYDFIYDTEFLTKEDHIHIEAAFRYFMELMDESILRGEISNWSLMEAIGGLYCAVVLQDRERMERFLFGTGGVTEHMSKGILNDGFWYECSIGYNLLCAGLLSEAAQIVKHFGIDLANLSVPASYSKRISYPKFVRDGLINEAWGPNTKAYRNISMLWDSLLPFFDYRGVIPGINDSCEMKISGIAAVLNDPRYDLAYYLYGKPEYGRAVKNLLPAERDLLFGRGDIPDTKTEEIYRKSVYADNGGLAILRSQTSGRSPAEQIQVALKYGCHGGAHGHYDRVSITGLSRYGKSLYSPEHTWFSYHTFMYKFYVQNSINHNMVTVDLKQQDPSEPARNLFYSGKKLQVCELQNYGKWCNPPYGGWSVDVPTFEERTWKEGKYVPIPENHPQYMERTEFTEDILQKRLTIVTDDYIVNFDYVKGEKEHQYDCIYHLKALKELEGKELRYRKHTDQLEENPLGSGQFITDCDWYSVKGITRLHFESFYDEEHNNGGKWLSSNRTAHNAYGEIKSDLYALWPVDYDLVIGHTPEFDHMYKQLWYEVLLDGDVKVKGNFGAWLLGKEKIHLKVEGAETLTLRIRVKDVEFEPDIMQYSKDNIFWGNPSLTLQGGEKVYLSDLLFQSDNTKNCKEAGKDYEGGPVKIQGEQMDYSIPAEPEDRLRTASITVDLRGRRAEYFDSCIGADYPIGNEEDIRRSVFFRTYGKETRYITVLEIYENDRMIKEIEQLDCNQLKVHLKDGRTQFIRVKNLEEDEITTEVELEEYSQGQLICKEASTIQTP